MAFAAAGPRISLQGLITMRKSLLVGILALLAVGPAGAMPLTGQSVSASFTPQSGWTTTTQFTSPAVVGPGVEFTGQVKDVFNQLWNISLDVGADTFTVVLNSPNPNANVAAGPYAIKLDVTGMTGLQAVSLSNFWCAPANTFPCITSGGNPAIRGLTSNSTSLSVQFQVLLPGERYVFGVPEPASLALMLGGFVSVVSVRRRKKAAQRS